MNIKKKKKWYNRQSIRLKGYDYSKNAMYFITINTYKNQYLFGKIIEGEMILNDRGKILQEEILKTEIIRKDIKIPDYIIMPNHTHFIIKKNTAKDLAPTNPEGHKQVSQRLTHALGIDPKSIGFIIGQIKSITNKRIGEGKIWHRNYYEHIIRNEDDYYRIAKYIENNPMNWKRKLV